MSDTGTGIVDAALGRMFERGFSTKGGCGLGLATVRQLAEERGGAVAALTKPDRGTTLEVYLPQSEDRPVTPGSLTRPKSQKRWAV